MPESRMRRHICVALSIPNAFTASSLSLMASREDRREAGTWQHIDTRTHAHTHAQWRGLRTGEGPQSRLKLEDRGDASKKDSAYAVHATTTTRIVATDFASEQTYLPSLHLPTPPQPSLPFVTHPLLPLVGSKPTHWQSECLSLLWHWQRIIRKSFFLFLFYGAIQPYHH